MQSQFDHPPGDPRVPSPAPLAGADAAAERDDDPEADLALAGQRVREAQTALAALGCFGAADEPARHIDGTFGPQSRAAVETFQAEQGLEVTGTLDEDTWQALRGAYEEGRSLQAQEPSDDALSATASGHGPAQPEATDDSLSALVDLDTDDT